MKSFAIILMVLCLVYFSGCFATNGGVQDNVPQPTKTQRPAATPSPIDTLPSVIIQTADPSPTPDVTEPEPTITIPATNVYTSIGLGLTFTVPQSWVGKYCVDEGDGYFSVCLNPTEPVEPYMGTTELFTIMKSTCVKWNDLSCEWNFDINGSTYGWGISSFDGYSGESDHETYIKMQYDVPAIFQTLRSVSGQRPDHVKTLWIETIPEKTEFTTTMGFGITFTFPKRWIGKCRIVESEDEVAFYFNPKEPIDKYSYGFFFEIDKNASASDYDMVDSIQEFKINGITYVSYTSTDVPYSEDMPEYDTYMSMYDDFQGILDSMRAVK